MKIRKFYKQQVSQIQGPKEKLNFLGAKTEIEEKEAQELLDAYFDNHKSSKAQSVKAEAWALILQGEDVSIKETCISSRLFTVSDKRIAGRISTTKN